MKFFLDKQTAFSLAGGISTIKDLSILLNRFFTLEEMIKRQAKTEKTAQIQNAILNICNKITDFVCENKETEQKEFLKNIEKLIINFSDFGFIPYEFSKKIQILKESVLYF
jgi:glutamate synthase domain-containing protein 1